MNMHMKAIVHDGINTNRGITAQIMHSNETTVKVTDWV